MSPTIFINYRISVSIKDANNLRTKLEAVLGEGVVFMDKYEIKTGEEWAKEIRTALEAAKVVLVLIGPGWLRCQYAETKPHKGKYWKDGARRLDNPEDWVRREIEIALADPDKSVHTLLFSGAELPDEADFPEESTLALLTQRQTCRITDDRFDLDVKNFIEEAGLREKLGLSSPDKGSATVDTVPAWQDPNADLPKDVLPASSAPFIGLRHFDEANARLFFGRGLEIQTLTQLIHGQREVRLTLLYGPTGVGKSSLLHAGLFPRLRQRGWRPVYLRRSEVKAEGFHAAFARALADESTLRLRQGYGGQEQVVFILDQVEEMFADPVPDEAAAFFDCLREALRSRPAAQFILGFRNDFLDSILKPLSERGLQETCDFRLHRVEPLGQQGIREAILGATQNPRLAEHYDFEFDPELPDLLLRDVLADHNPLAHKALLLQIQLRKLWDDARALYPEGHLTIRRELYRKSETLDALVQQQLDLLEAAWPEQVQSGLTLDVLQGFTTPLSTAAVQANETVLNTYPHVPGFSAFFNALKNTYLLLEQGRVATRLAHDALAPLIRQRFAASDKPGQRAARILESKKEDIADYRGEGELFTAGDLKLLELGKNGMRAWSGKEEVAIVDCRSEMEQRLVDETRRKEQLVRSALREAGQCILHLEYDEALNFITGVMREGVKTEEIFQILLEVAFFWAECGQTTSALSVLVNMEGLGGFRIEGYEKIKQDKKALREYVRQLAERHDCLAFLEERYYPKMIAVAGGDFDMGDEEFEDARPVHRVTLSSFHIAETPTTNWQYGLYCAATGKNIQDTKYSWHIEGDNPVIKVSWYDAVAYANWLSRQQGISPAYNVDTDLLDPNDLDEQNIDWLKTTDFRSGGYRLPTEAEWEYAARGGESASRRMTKYAGSNDIDEVAWYSENSKNRTSAVKKLKANELGLFDMSGNVWEWCWDWYDSKYYEKLRDAPKKDPPGPQSGSSRVWRGGSWGFDLNYCSVRRRDGIIPRDRDDDCGFRLAQDK